MNTNTHSFGIWNDFYETYGRFLAKTAEPDVWYPVVKQALRRNDFVVPFFALARYEASCGEPLVIRNDDPDTCVGRIANAFGFNYGVFGDNRDNRDRLSEQLSSFSVNLIESGSGKIIKQYLRTIHKISGAVYLKAAKKAAKIPPDKWIVDNDLHPLISEEARKYLNRNEGDDGLVSDVRDFFCALRKRFRRYNSMPTAASFRDDAPELSGEMLKSILKALDTGSPQSGNDIVETIEDPCPVFRFDDRDHRDRLVLGFRFARSWHFDVAEAIRTVQFVFKRHNPGSDSVIVRFRKGPQDGWRTDDDQKCVPVEEADRVLRVEFDQDGQRIGDPVDVTPSVFSDPETTWLLFKQNADGSVCVVESPEPLSRGARYFSVWLHGCPPEPVEWIGASEDPKCGNWSVVGIDAGGFSVPEAAERIRIGETEYDVVTVVDEWLDRSSAFGSYPASGRVVNAGSRLFFEKGVIPFSDSFLESETIRARYRKADGTEFVFEDGNLRTVPDEILWDRGKIEFFDSDTGETKGRRAVTFLPEIDASELDGVFGLDADRTATVSISGETVEVVVSRADGGTVSGHVDFELHGFSFRYPVRRCGMLVGVDGSGEASMPLRSGIGIELAEDDFEAARFSVEPPSLAQSLAVEHPIGDSRRPGKTKFRSTDLLADPDESTLGNWLFSSDAGDLGALCVYRPDQTPWNGVSGHPVNRERQGDDLVVSFWIARRWRNKPLSLVYLPAHRQDQAPEFVPATEEDFENANGRLRSTTRIAGFYAKTDIEWGAGLLCFISFPTSGIRWRAVSSGFFLPRPDDKGPWSLSAEEDPFGLRGAMATSDLARIDEIMSSKDPACRDFIRKFEEKTYRALYSLGAENMRYFHAYYSRCRKADGTFEPSGYFFMAGWLVEERMIEKQSMHSNIPVLKDGYPILRMNENYKGMWSPLLVRYSKLYIEDFKRLYERMRINGEREIHFWVRACTFNEPAVASLGKEMASVIKDVKEWASGFIPDFKPRRDDPSFSEDEEEFFGTKKGTDIEKSLSRLAKGVVEWRRIPTCESAQPLRDLLLRIEQIDAEIRQRLETVWDDSATRAGTTNPQTKFTMTDRIAMKSWLLS